MRTRLVFVAFLVLSCSVSAQQPESSPAPASAATSGIAAEVMAFEAQIELATVRGDVAFVDASTSSDFTFTHRDSWTSGGKESRTDDKKAWLATVAKAPYLYRNLDSIQVELHGDVVITFGRYKMRQKANPKGPESSVWFERVYAKRNGRWQYLSHRTVHGPVNEPS